MKTTKRSHGRTLMTALALALGAALASGQSAGQATYATPEEAIRAVGDAAGTGDRQKGEEIFGKDGFVLLESGDPVADRQDRLQVKKYIEEKIAFEDRGVIGKFALLGNDRWPFPIPLVLENGRWHFNVAAGREEIEKRRVGRNELSTLGTMRAYVAAQREYFAAKYAGGKTPAYAARFFSSEGKTDGLYWPVAANARKSPLGPLVASAAQEGYAPGNQPSEPFHGYYFRILKAQGASAPRGARSYLDDEGRMTSGFALLAWPAKYGSSGVMTFQVNRQGIVFQKDLGPSTTTAVAGITAYDPDDTWTPTEDGF